MSDAAMLERPAGSAETHVGFTPEQLTERTIHRRAVEAVIWGMSAVNFDLMLQALIEGGGGPNQIALWSRPPDGKNQTLTPNPNTIYLMPFFDTKIAGPMVLEIPPANGGRITGSIDDSWQCALEDVGLPFEMTLRPSQLRAEAAEAALMVPAAAEMAPHYAELKVPVQIISNEGDHIVDHASQSGRLAAELPTAKLTTLHGAGHMAHHTAADRVLGAIRQAMRQQSTIGA